MKVAATCEEGSYQDRYKSMGYLYSDRRNPRWMEGITRMALHIGMKNLTMNANDDGIQIHRNDPDEGKEVVTFDEYEARELMTMFVMLQEAARFDPSL